MTFKAVFPDIGARHPAKPGDGGLLDRGLPGSGVSDRGVADAVSGRNILILAALASLLRFARVGG
ncbi:MAG: hypothetical protein ABW213_15740 [Tardiphaga sp.]